VKDKQLISQSVSSCCKSNTLFYIFYNFCVFFLSMAADLQPVAEEDDDGSRKTKSKKAYSHKEVCIMCKDGVPVSLKRHIPSFSMSNHGLIYTHRFLISEISEVHFEYNVHLLFPLVRN